VKANFANDGYPPALRKHAAAFTKIYKVLRSASLKEIEKFIGVFCKTDEQKKNDTHEQNLSARDKLLGMYKQVNGKWMVR